jgi:hypothetical protein
MASVSSVKKEIKRGVKRTVAESEAVLAKRRAKVSAELDGLLGTLSGKISDVRDSIASAADEGAAMASRGLDQALAKSRRGVRQLEKRWRKMDTKQKATVVGGVLAALAAAAATPAIVRKVRGR